MKKTLIIFWTIFWAMTGIYFVICALPVGAGWSTFAALVSGFMTARNMADVVQHNAALTGRQKRRF